MKVKGSFVEVDQSDAEELGRIEILLKRDLPRACQMLNIIKLTTQGCLPKDKIDSTIYKFAENNDDEEESKLFLVYAQRPNMCSEFGVTILPPPSPTPEMIEELSKLFDWKQPILFQSCPLFFWEAHLKHLCHSHAGHTSSRLFIPTLWLLSQEAASKIEVESSGTSIGKGGESSEEQIYEMKSLGREDVYQILRNWNYQGPSATHQITTFLDHLQSCGLFVKKGGNGEELACFFILTAFGLFSNLRTEADFRGRGYAIKVIQWITSQAAGKHGLEIAVETADDNTACQACLTKCGFQKVHEVAWYWFEPKNKLDSD